MAKGSVGPQIAIVGHLRVASALTAQWPAYGEKLAKYAQTLALPELYIEPRNAQVLSMDQFLDLL